MVCSAESLPASPGTNFSVTQITVSPRGKFHQYVLLKHFVCSSHPRDIRKRASRAPGWSLLDFANRRSQSPLHQQRIDSCDRGSGTTYSVRSSSDHRPCDRFRLHECCSPEDWEQHSSRALRTQPHWLPHTHLPRRPSPY